jgi:hypothetical protein
LSRLSGAMRVFDPRDSRCNESQSRTFIGARGGGFAALVNTRKVPREKRCAINRAAGSATLLR